MADQPEALRLADALRDGTYLLSQERNATEAELRRLHAEVERITVNGTHSCHAECQRPVCRLTRERDALLSLIADDAFASSFQTMAQYRSALLKATKGGGNG